MQMRTVTLCRVSRSSGVSVPSFTQRAAKEAKRVHAEALGIEPLFFTNTPQRYPELAGIVCDTNDPAAIAGQVGPPEIYGMSPPANFLSRW
ncbi:MAG TPA: hypothetical protein VGF67_33200 [Ktedonobacteraceae bacterium]